MDSRDAHITGGHLKKSNISQTLSIGSSMAVLLQAEAIDSGRIWLLLGTIGLVLATGYFVRTGWGKTGTTKRKLSAITVAVAAIGSLAYLLLALGYGTMTVQYGSETHTVYWLHFVDWLLTTPLILLALAVLVSGSRRTAAALIGFDASMVVLGLATVLTDRGMGGLDADTLRITLLGMSIIAYLGVFLLLVRPLSRSAAQQSTEVAMLFSMLRNAVVVLFGLYPLVWLFGHVVAILPTTGLLFAYLLLDLLVKVGVGTVLLQSDTSIDERQNSKPRTLGG